MTDLFLLGGFLGSGKTTAICQAAELLNASGRPAALVTNDQGRRLVDGALAKEMGLAAREVTGGCFCCRYEDLDAALGSLSATERPEVVFAESVGSCTDMVATVVKPLEKFHPELRVILSVFADALRMAEIAASRPPFGDAELDYIYFKQLEEADLLVVNKADLVSPDVREEIARMLRMRYPGKPFRFQHSLDTEDVRDWLEMLSAMKVPESRLSLDIDYDTYGAGEALLAWLDEELEIVSPGGRALEAATVFVNAVYHGVRRAGYRIGHLKFLLREAEWHRKISFTAPDEPLLRQTTNPIRFTHLDVVVNARVACEPEALRGIVEQALRTAEKQVPFRARSLGTEAFSPGYPKPSHRIG